MIALRWASSGSVEPLFPLNAATILFSAKPTIGIPSHNYLNQPWFVRKHKKIEGSLQAPNIVTLWVGLVSCLLW